MVLSSSFVVKRGSLECKDCGLKFTHWEVFQTHLHQHALEEEEEEEEEAQMGDNRNPAADLDSGKADDGENGDEDTGGDADECDMSSSSQAEPSGLMQGLGVTTASIEKKLQKVYTCLDCGKVYTYLVSFRKHQRLHEKQSPTTKSVQNLCKYECPECGLSFIRRARLLGHLRVHRSRTSSKLPRCDQCNKDFASPKSWIVHLKLHKRNPFWCLTCAKGFKEEAALDKHLQSHNLGQHKRSICRNSFHMSTHLKNYYTTHSGAKPYQCTGCGKRFSHLGNLILHRKKYLGVHVSSNGMKSCAVIAKKQVRREEKELILTSDEEESEMDTNLGELPGNEESETQKPCEDAEFGDHANSEESHCGEPVRHFELSKPLGLAGSDQPDELKSETEQPQAGQELDESESEETNMDREHRYWEWECCECDMGFDDVTKLHLHYIKHATGELPIPQDCTEG